MARSARTRRWVCLTAIRSSQSCLWAQNGQAKRPLGGSGSEAADGGGWWEWCAFGTNSREGVRNHHNTYLGVWGGVWVG